MRIISYDLGSVSPFLCQVTLEVKGEPQILNLSEKLKAGGIAHKLWIEQPENIPTCLATKPYPKSVVALFFKKLKLCKWCILDILIHKQFCIFFPACYQLWISCKSVKGLIYYVLRFGTCFMTGSDEWSLDLTIWSMVWIPIRLPEAGV